MCGHGLTRPDGTDFAGRAVADGDDEIQWRGVWLRELVPRLGAELIDFVVQPLEQIESVGIDRAAWMRPGGIGFEAARAHLVEDGFGDDRARRIAGAEEQDVVGHARFRGGQQALTVWARGAQISARPPQQSLVRNSSKALIAAKSNA